MPAAACRSTIGCVRVAPRASIWSPKARPARCCFTQADVRALQLAKAAIAAGWTLLLRSAGIEPEDLDRVYVAGAFGNYLDVQNSLAIGLFPPVGAGRISFVGNAAGVGAQMALIDVRARERIARLRARIRFLELATNAEFLEVFSSHLGF